MTVEEAEVEQMRAAIKRLPGWRRPLSRGGHSTAKPTWLERAAAKEQRDRENASLCDAVLQLCSDVPRSAGEIVSGVLENWGEVEHVRITAQLSALLRAGEVVSTPDGYLRREE